MTMDVVRTCSKRLCRFFYDDTREIQIKWYRSPVNAKCFPTAHKWGHLAWYSQPWLAEGVGEVYDAKEKWSNGFTPPSATGQRFFGLLTNFQNGASFDPAVDVQRDQWGLALDCPGCCKAVILLESDSGFIALTEDNNCIAVEDSPPCLEP